MHSCQNEFATADEGLTDKIGYHGYHRFYPWFLQEFRARPVRFLEIGLDQLGSVKLWQRYFRDGLELHGIDRDDKEFEDDRVRLHKLDQSSPVELQKFVENLDAAFDVILDDGSHIPEHQILTLHMLWPVLKPGGIYILEDIETSYWGLSELYGYRFDARKHSKNLIDQLRSSIDAVNFEALPYFMKRRIERHSLQAVLREIEMVSFGQNCIVMQKKNHEWFGKYYDRDYVFADKYMCKHRFVRVQQRMNRGGFLGILRGCFRRLIGANSAG